MIGFVRVETTDRIKGDAGMGDHTQSSEESKKPARRTLRTPPSCKRDVINPSSAFSGAAVPRDLFGGRLAVNGCTQDTTHTMATPCSEVIAQ